MQLELLPEDFSQKRVMVSLSGGIDSMGVLCYLASVYPRALVPDTIYLYYVHIREHSPGTARFVADGIRYAKRHFKRVVWGYYNAGSVLEFFRGENIIPHPAISPCSAKLKMQQIEAFRQQHDIEVDLIGYLAHEKRRINRAIKHGANDQGKYFIAAHLYQRDVFALVKREIGWYPAIYDIRDEDGRRKFIHNNCLPCKNMAGRLDGATVSKEFLAVAEHYPDNFWAARQLSIELGAHWGRDDADDVGCAVCSV